MHLSVANGVITYDKIQIKPKELADELIESSNKNSYNLQLVIQNESWKSFRLYSQIEKDYVLGLQFSSGLLLSVNILLALRFENYSASDQRKVLQGLLNSWNGSEAIYPWGSIEISDDNKAGFVSIIIKYF